MILLLFTFFVLISWYAFTIDGFRSRYQKLVFSSIGLLLIIYVGLRDGKSVNDYEVYIDLFNKPNLVLEPTFTFISYVIKNFLFGEVLILFIIYAILGVSIKLMGIQQLTPFLFFSLLVYASNFLILHEMTQIRVGIASGILLLCIKPLYEREGVKFLLLCCVAALFHYSAIILFPLWFLNGDKPRKLVLLFALPLAFLIYFLNFNLVLNIPIPYLQNKIAGYQELQALGLNGFDKINVFNSLYLLRCGIYFLFLYKYDLLRRSNTYGVILLKIYGISLFVLPAFAVMPVVAFRINELLGVVEIILMPMILYLFNPTWFSKLLVFFICLAVLLMNVFYNKFIF